MFRRTVWALLGLSCASLLAAEDGVRLRGNPSEAVLPSQGIESSSRFDAWARSRKIRSSCTARPSKGTSPARWCPIFPSARALSSRSRFRRTSSARTARRQWPGWERRTFPTSSTASADHRQLAQPSVVDRRAHGGECRLGMFRDGASQSDLDLFAVMQDGACSRWKVTLRVASSVTTPRDRSQASW